MSNKKKSTDLNKRSLARGVGARATDVVNDNGASAYSNARKSTKGFYRVAFTQVYEKVSERDIELKMTYAKDLLSNYIGVPADMITLRAKRNSAKQTLTCLDEVLYVRVGKDVYGKISIRTQRMLKYRTLIFIYQTRKIHEGIPRKSFSSNRGFKKATTSQLSERKRQSYRKRKTRRS